MVPVADRDELIELLRRETPALQREFGIRRLGIFGSFARGVVRPDSDVDIVAEFESPPGLRFVSFVEKLEELLGRDTDVLTPSGIAAIRARSVADRIRKSIVYV